MNHLEDFLREATDAGASDLFFVAGAVPCMAVDGEYIAMRSAQGRRIDPFTLENFARALMTPEQWAEFELTHEANLSYMQPRIGRFRASVYWQRGSVGIVLRRVSMIVPTMRQLGLPTVLREIALESHGIVLITGSTGSGKSTTMASMIDYRNHILSGHIITIEDPVEYVFQHRRSIVTQREVGIDTMSFHDAMRNSLRQAPQVICIGEMRDEESVRFAMHAAETGHLVFATLHSTNATLALERVPHFYPPEAHAQVQLQLSLNLKAIISQRLVPRINGGRAAAIEVLINAPHVSQAIKKGEMSLIRQALMAENNYGIQSFDLALYRMVQSGIISADDALQAADSADDLAMRFRGIGVVAGSSWTQTGDPWAEITDDYRPPEGTLSSIQMQDADPARNYSNEGVPPLSPDAIGYRPPVRRAMRDPETRRFRELEGLIRALLAPQMERQAARDRKANASQAESREPRQPPPTPPQPPPPRAEEPPPPPREEPKPEPRPVPEPPARQPESMKPVQLAASIGAPKAPVSQDALRMPPAEMTREGVRTPQAPAGAGHGEHNSPQGRPGQKRPSTEIKYKIFDTHGDAVRAPLEPPPASPPPAPGKRSTGETDLDLDELD